MYLFKIYFEFFSFLSDSKYNEEIINEACRLKGGTISREAVPVSSPEAQPAVSQVRLLSANCQILRARVSNRQAL